MMPIIVDLRQDDADNISVYKRTLNLSAELKNKSCFLFGPRATGKSWLIRNDLKDSQVFNLLDQNTYTRLLRAPHLLASEINSKLVVIDEIQKIPQLLDEVHRLIEEKRITFLLTGSSARKLKRGGANLLAGRARSLSLYPLTTIEIKDFNIIQYCNHGGLPMIYESNEAWLDLRDYCLTYIKEEIQAEAIVRRVDHFARFLDVIGSRSGKEMNFESISKDSGVPVRTVAQFVEVLKDTLIAYELLPYKKTKKNKSASKIKLYFFDVGVANYLSGRKEIIEKSEAFSEAFEHFLIQETRAAIGYQKRDTNMMHWRTQNGRYEVDLILDQDCAIEFKAGSSYRDEWIKSLRALKEEKNIKNFYCVSLDETPRVIDGIQVISWKRYLKLLWSGDLFIN